jgi:hypothetical protein
MHTVSSGLWLALKMEAICFPETLVTTYQTTQRHNPEYHNRHLNRRENLKSQIKPRHWTWETSNNHETPRQVCYPTTDLNQVPPEYKTKTLPLHHCLDRNCANQTWRNRLSKHLVANSEPPCNEWHQLPIINSVAYFICSYVLGVYQEARVISPPHPTTFHPAPQRMIRAGCRRLLFMTLVSILTSCVILSLPSGCQALHHSYLYAITELGHTVQYRMSGNEGGIPGFDILKSRKPVRK